MSGISRLGAEWSYVKIKHQPLKPDGTKRGDPEIECLQCGHVFRGGASRIRSHLLGTKDGVSACDAVSEEDKQKLGKIAQEKSEQQLSKKRKTDLDNLTRSNSDPSAASTSNSSRFNPITSAFQKVDKASADASVARFFYANGLPFNAARSSQYSDMIDQITKMPPGYKPPTYNRIRDELLDQEKARVAADLKSCIDSSAKAGPDITSDGWSDARSRPLLNFLLLTTKGAQFIKAVDTTGQSKTDDYIADMLSEAIEEAGPENVVQVITDSAANCKAAGKLVEQQ